MSDSPLLELQRGANDSKVRVVDLLRQALVVARKAKADEAAVWIAAELNGYAAGSDVPAYRIVTGTVKAWNPYRGWIPAEFSNPQLGEAMSHRKAIQGIAEFEHLLASESSGMVQMPFTPDQLALLKSNVPLQPTLLISVTSIVHILDAVRTRVLDWALTLEGQLEGQGVSIAGPKTAPAASSHGMQPLHIETHFHSDVSGVQLQQFTTHSAQSLSVEGLNLEALRVFVGELREAIPRLGLAPEVAQELDADVITMEVHARSQKPKMTILRDSLRSAQTILEGAASSALGAGLVAEAVKLLGG